MDRANNMKKYILTTLLLLGGMHLLYSANFEKKDTSIEAGNKVDDHFSTNQYFYNQFYRLVYGLKIYSEQENESISKVAGSSIGIDQFYQDAFQDAINKGDDLPFHLTTLYLASKKLDYKELNQKVRDELVKLPQYSSIVHYFEKNEDIDPKAMSLIYGLSFSRDLFNTLDNVSSNDQNLETAKSFEEKLNNSSLAYAQKTAKIILTFIIFLGISFGLFLFFIYSLINGMIRLKYDPKDKNSILSLEVFTYYILFFCFLGVLGKFKDSLLSLLPGVNGILLNIILIPAAFFTILAYVIARYGFINLLKEIGLKIKSPLYLVKEYLMGPITYLTCVVPIIGLMFLYQQVLTYFNVSSSSGSHPIIPILIDSDDPTIKLRILFLAVLIAPITEEVFFRGFFHNYLRSFLNPFSAIIINGIFFAAIHPQGPVGIFPLTIIGCILAFAREWRDNLYTPILIHMCVNGVTTFAILELFSK